MQKKIHTKTISQKTKDKKSLLQKKKAKKVNCRHHTLSAILGGKCTHGLIHSTGKKGDFQVRGNEK